VTTETAEFTGFRPEAVHFLVGLALNNDRAWFQPRKAEYEALLKGPLERLCTAVDAEFRARGVPLSADPARSPFRIYRDVRFSKDKSPYKTNVGASFAWAGDGAGGAGGEARGPGGYFHFEPGETFVGGGIWHPEPARLAAWRSLVVADRERVHAAVEDPAFRETFGAINGDRLVRVPAGFAADDPDVELLKLKDVVFGRRLPDEDVYAPDLPARIAGWLADAVPLLELLAGLPGGDEASGRRRR
jgi:uncharacterized protein (TIGR02453 family)